MNDQTFPTNEMAALAAIGNAAAVLLGGPSQLTDDLRSEFDSGPLRRRLQIDYLDFGRVRLAELLVGKSLGKQKEIELSAKTVNLPSGPRSLRGRTGSP